MCSQGVEWGSGNGNYWEETSGIRRGFWQDRPNRILTKGRQGGLGNWESWRTWSGMEGELILRTEGFWLNWFSEIHAEAGRAKAEMEAQKAWLRWRRVQRSLTPVCPRRGSWKTEGYHKQSQWEQGGAGRKERGKWVWIVESCPTVCLPMQETKEIRVSVPGSRRSPGGGHSKPLQYSGLENSMGTGSWQAAVHRVAESDMTETT